MTRKLSFLVLAGALFVGMSSCQNLTSPNFNFEDLQNLVENPTPTGLFAAAQGMLVTRRDMDANGANDQYGQTGILGRESYNLDVNDPRFGVEMLNATLDAESPAFGANYWSEPYENVRVADIILNGIPNSTPPLSDNEAQWLQGFVKTMAAYDFMTIALLRDTQCGCPITVSESLTEPAPAVSVDQVWSHLIGLLEEAKGHLQQASGPSPIALSTGFDGITGVVQVGFFRDAEGFLQFNRAIRARAAMYNEDWTGVLQALSESFINETSLNLGVYHAFSSQSGDVLNGFAQFGDNPNLRAHPYYKADVELKPDGSPDDRFTRKIRPVTSRPYNGQLCLGDASPTPWEPDPRYVEDPGGGGNQRDCDITFNLYPTTTTPLPIIRNEELLLMRAEANIRGGSLGAAQSDINLVRSVSGGLPAVTLSSQDQAIDQLLYERRYSLWWEYGHRWLDMRRYNRLNELPVDAAGMGVASFYPIPGDETRGRL